MPSIPYILTGTVKKGPKGGYGEVEHTVVQADGGATVNLQIDAGTTLATNFSFTLLNVTTNESVSLTTDADGIYTYDLQNLSTAYSNSDVLRLYGEDIDETRRWDSADSTRKYKPEADARVARVIHTGRSGKEYTEEYPFPTQVMNFIVNSENPSGEYTYTGGNLTEEVQTIRGRRFRKKYTYSSGNLISETAWEEI